MAGTRRVLGLSRREVALALAVVPLTTCIAKRPDKDVPFLSKKDSIDIAPEDPGRLVELVKLDPSIKLDMRYATTNNFTGKVLYDAPRAFLTIVAAEALVRAHARANKDGFGFTIFDAYRPWSVTRMLWDSTPKSQKNYVANPKRGSKHNRGCAVDMTLHDLKTGQLVEMPTDFDSFTEKAHRDYMGASPAATANRNRLQSYMEGEHFVGLSNEWWHFDFEEWEQFPVRDTPFDQII